MSNAIILCWLFVLTLAVIGLFAGWIGHRHKLGEMAEAERKRKELNLARYKAIVELPKSKRFPIPISGSGGTGDSGDAA